MDKDRKDSDLRAHAEAICLAAEAVPAEQRWDYVGQACAGDVELRAAVERRLVGALTTPGLGLYDDALDFDDDELRPGVLLGGRYRVLHRIGAGGLGVVFLAQQELPVRRKVAIKALHAGLKNRAAVRRFETEIDALSRMNHPNVASIFDAGRTDTGRLYVVMEYIDGEPFDVYCKNHALSLEATLRLIIEICRGVHHAHQRGVIHRDLKPMNILVKHDTPPVPRVIDFGIARASLGAAMAEGRLTVQGAHIGTPEYMSPEQAGLTGADTGIASDVYSLGVMLYEALTGSLPVTFTDRTDPLAWRRVLGEARILPPSQRAREPRGQEPAPYPGSRLRGDLDAIVMTALATDPDRRYASANELAADIERYLTGSPILARPPGLAYVFSRAVKRNRVAAIASAIALLTLIATGATLAIIDSDRQAERQAAEEARTFAEIQRATAESAAAHAARTSARSALAAAVTALGFHDAAAVQGNLDAIAPPYRGWEWALLRRLSDQADGHFRLGEGNAISLDVAPDERTLAVGAEDGTIRRVDGLSGEVLAVLRGHSLPVVEVVHSLDGALLLSSDRADRLCLWDLPTGRLRWTVRGPHHITSLAFVPDAEGSPQQVLVSLQVRSGEEATAEGAPHSPHLLAISTGEVVRRVPIELGGPVPVWWCRQDTDRLIVGSDAASTAAYSPAGELLWTVPGRVETLPGLPPCDRMSTITPDVYEVRQLRRTRDGRRSQAVRSLGGIWHKSTLGPGGLIAWNEGSSTVGLQDLTGHLPPLRLIGHVGAVHSLRFAPSEPRLWSTDQQGNLLRWDTQLLAQPLRLDSAGEVLQSGAISPDLKIFASATWGIVRALDSETLTPSWHRWLGRAYITALDFSPDGRRLGVADWQGNVWSFDTQSGEIVAEAKLPGQVLVRLLWLDDASLVVATAHGELIALSPGDNPSRPLWTQEPVGELPVLALARSPGTDRIAVALGNPERLPEGGRVAVPERRQTPPSLGAVRILDARTGSTVVSMQEASTTWLALAFSPDASQLYGSGEDGTIRVWDTTSGEPLRTRPGPGGRIMAFAFTGAWSGPADSSRDQDGGAEARVVASLDSGGLAFWTADDLDFLFALDTRTPRPLTLAMTPDERRLGLITNEQALVLLDLGEVSNRAMHHRGARVAAKARRALAELGDAALAAASLEETGDPDAAEAAFWARRWGTNLNANNSWAWARVLYKETFEALSPKDRELVVARARATATSGQISEFENTLALALLRAGQHREAIEAALRSEAYLQARGISEAAADRAIIAMARHELGDHAAARQELARAEAESAHPAWRGDSSLIILLAEARALIAR